MKKEENIEKIYLSKESINGIVNKIRNLSFDGLKKSFHYEMSLLRKDANEDFLEDYFIQFDKIKMIFYRKRPSGFNNFDFFYLKDDGMYIIYSINLDKKPLELINAIFVWRKFESYKQHIMKSYPDKIV